MVESQFGLAHIKVNETTASPDTGGVRVERDRTLGKLSGFAIVAGVHRGPPGERRERLGIVRVEPYGHARVSQCFGLCVLQR